MMKNEFKGKVALITGAAGAIGKGVAIKLLEGGSRVFITDLKEEMLDEVCQEIGCKGMAANVTSESQVKAVVEKTLETYGTIDILINVAGIIGTSALEDITEDEWDQMFDVNCKGTFFFTKYAVPVMKEKKGEPRDKRYERDVELKTKAFGAWCYKQKHKLCLIIGSIPSIPFIPVNNGFCVLLIEVAWR